MDRLSGALVSGATAVLVLVSVVALDDLRKAPPSDRIPARVAQAAHAQPSVRTNVGRARGADARAGETKGDQPELGLDIESVESSGDSRGSKSSMFGDEAEARSVQDVWSGEPADVEWTTEVRGYTSMAMADARVPAERLLGIDCRETLCRIRYHFPDVAEAAALRDLRNPDTELRVFPDSAGPTTYNVFIAKSAGALAPQRFASAGAAGHGGLDD